MEEICGNFFHFEKKRLENWPPKLTKKIAGMNLLRRKNWMKNCDFSLWPQMIRFKPIDRQMDHGAVAYQLGNICSLTITEVKLSRFETLWVIPNAIRLL